VGRLAEQLKTDSEALARGEAFKTASPIGDRDEPRSPTAQPNGCILLRIKHSKHATLVTEAAQQGVRRRA